ncbi:MAG: formylglycine-generating enzyme family protein, partial [Pirellulaceae bacterium]|nr:formylglycine-generating enzyme family protein [Pirellulaceae bacterium]
AAPAHPATPPPLKIELFTADVPGLRSDQVAIGLPVPPEHPGAESTRRGPLIPIPAPPSLADPNEFGRRLKPLRRFRRNPRKPRLDVARTVERICDEDIWDLVVRYPLDRCLHLTWIMDEGGSMDLWRQTGRELFVACRDSGAFRTCQAMQWTVGGQLGQLQSWFTPLDASARNAAAAPRNSWPETAHDRLIVIFGDCSSGRWYDPPTLRELRKLTELSQVLIVNPLPERMWGRTALGQAAEVGMWSPMAASPNRRLRVVRAAGRGGREKGLESDLKLLAVSVDADHWLGWSRFAAGQRPEYPGFCLSADQPPAARPVESLEWTAQQRLAAFTRYASRGGRELARLVSALPLVTPRFVRLVRQKMLTEDDDRGHLFEVELLLSPLLREEPRVRFDGRQVHELDTSQGPGATGDRIYQFCDGVQELLLDQTRTEYVREVFELLLQRAVPEDLRRENSLDEYAAMILRASEEEPDCEIYRLSEVSTELILRRLGGEYLRLLDDCRRSSLRLRLNNHLRRAEQARSNGDEPAALDALGQARSLVSAEQQRFGDAGPLLDEQLAFYEALVRVERVLEESQRVRQPFVESTTGMILAPISAGSFLMGSPEDEPGRNADESPRHRVTLSHDFWIGIHPVTQRQYQLVMGDNPSRFQGPERPVENVTWQQATEFCELLTKHAASAGQLPEGYTFRLPTEAEWEYCCRAGTETATAFGDSLSSEQANFDGNHPYGDAAKGPYLQRTSDVGSYPPNPWGLYDMHGNVWEWCLDQADWGESGIKTDTYVENITDPLCRRGRRRVVRGGGWIIVGWDCRSAYRYAHEPGNRSGHLGFRVCLARSPAGPEANQETSRRSRERRLRGASGRAERGKGPPPQPE